MAQPEEQGDRMKDIFTEADEVRWTLRRFCYGLPWEKRRSGSLLVRRDDFELLKTFYKVDDRKDSNLGYKFEGLPLLVLDNPKYRFEHTEFVEGDSE